MKKIARLLRINHSFISVYNAKSNPCERFHQQLKAHLRCFLAHEKVKDWPFMAMLAMYNFNHTPGLSWVFHLTSFYLDGREEKSFQKLTLPQFILLMSIMIIYVLIETYCIIPETYCIIPIKN